MAYKLELRKLNTAGTTIMKWTIPVFDTFNFQINTPVTPTPLPEEDSAEQILVKVEGNSTQVNLTWKLINYSTNQITGSGFSGNSKTIWEQMLGMKNQFRPISIDDAFELAVVDDTNQDVISWGGTTASMQATINSMSPVIATANVKFMEGNVVTLYNGDGAKPPINFSASTGSSSGEIDLTWANPTDTGTGNPSLTGYRIRYKTGNVEWTTEDYTGSATSKTLTSLTAGSTYDLQVSATTANSTGNMSKMISAVAKA